MNALPEVRKIPGRLVEGSLAIARIPVGIAALLAGERENPEWAPAVVADVISSLIEGSAGSVLGDPSLAERGRARRERDTLLRRASADEPIGEAEWDAAIAESGIVAASEIVAEPDPAAVSGQPPDDVAPPAAKATRSPKATQTTKAAKAIGTSKPRKRKPKPGTTAGSPSRTTVVRQPEETDEEVAAHATRAGSQVALNEEEHAQAITRAALEADEFVDLVDSDPPSTD